MENERKPLPAKSLLVFAAACFAGAIAIRVAMSNPDFARTFNMRAARMVKRIAEAQVSAWQEISDKASTYYQKQRI
jgi:hypothetical protein